MNPTPTTTAPLSVADRLRIRWAVARYDLFLDLHSVPGRHRRELRNELRSNLSEAASAVGARQALAGVGSLRALARENAIDGQLRSRWVAGFVAGLTTLAALFVAFLFLSLYYASGVLDAGATGPVATWLFPFVGSEVSVDPSDGLTLQFQTGPLPLVAALIVWLAVSRPWRAIARRLGSRSLQGA